MAAFAEIYLADLQQHTSSSGTAATRAAELRPFFLWAQERDLIRPEQITRSILESYQRHLARYRKTNGKALGIGTRRTRLTAVRRYFAWLCRTRRLEANPASELVLPKRQRRLPPEPLSVSEVNAVLALPDLADPLGIRDRAILELFYSTGIRRA